MRIVEDHTFNLYERGVRRLVVLLERSEHDPFVRTEFYAGLLAELADRRAAESYKAAIAAAARAPRKVAKKPTAKPAAKSRR